jgi:hypothetical protein
MILAGSNMEKADPSIIDMTNGAQEAGRFAGAGLPQQLLSAASA